MPDVSVVIPAWNAATFIDKAVTSALRQDGVTLEVIVVDDASTDATADRVAAISDPRIRYLRLNANRGPSGARNAALDVADGDWIAVLDADDQLLPGRLARLVRTAEQHDLDIIADNLWIERATPAGVTHALMIPEAVDDRLTPLDLAAYLRGNCLFGKGPGYGYLKPLFHRGFLSHHNIRYDEALRIGEDCHLVVEALANGARYSRQAFAGYVYSSRPHSISHRLSLANATAMIAADRRFLAHFGHRLTADETRAARAHLRSLEEGACFVAMVTSIKQRRLRDLWSQARRHPAALRHFAMPIRAALGRLYGAAA